MIVKEFYKTREDGVNLFRTYSNNGVKIRKLAKNWLGNFAPTKKIYDEAIDVEGAPYIYEETDLPIDKTEENGEG